MKKNFKVTLLPAGAVLAGIILTISCANNANGDGPLANKLSRWTGTKIDTVYSYDLMAHRGDIVDCNGKTLATVKAVADIYWDSQVLGRDEEVKDLAKDFARLIGSRTEAEYDSLLMAARERHCKYVLVEKAVDSSVVARIIEQPFYSGPRYHSGIIIERSYRREYPYGELAKRSIGYVRCPELDRGVGVDWTYNDTLKGRDGYRLDRVNAKTSKRRTIKTVMPVHGATVPMTLDIEMQACADSVMRAYLDGVQNMTNACLVIADVNTGAIKTMVNFVPDENGVLREHYNNAVAFGYSPGMIISPATALAACKCDTTVDLGKYDVSVPGDLRDMTVQCDSKAYLDTLMSILTSGSSEKGFEIQGMCPIKTHEEPHRDYIIKRYMAHVLPCGYAVTGSTISWLNLHTAIARGGESIPLRITEMTPEAPAATTICTKDQARHIARSMQNALDHDILAEARFEIAGLHGMSFTRIEKMANPVSGERTRSAQCCFAGFFPVDKPSYSIIVMLHFNPYSHKSCNPRELTSVIVKGVVDSDVIYQRLGGR